MMELGNKDNRYPLEYMEAFVLKWGYWEDQGQPLKTKTERHFTLTRQAQRLWEDCDSVIWFLQMYCCTSWGYQLLPVLSNGWPSETEQEK